MGVAPLDYGPVLLRKPFGSRLAADTLPSGCPCGQNPTVGASPWLCPSFPTSCPFRVLHGRVPRPTRHYPRLWIRRPSSERPRDLNPPDQNAAQHTLRASPPPQAARPVPRGRPVGVTRPTAWGFPCCVGSPCADMPSPLPRWDRWVGSLVGGLFTLPCPQRRRPSPSQWRVGSHIETFRGLLGVHSRYGLPARRTAKRSVVSKAPTASLPPPPLRLLPAGANQLPGGIGTR